MRDHESNNVPSLPVFISLGMHTLHGLLVICHCSMDQPSMTDMFESLCKCNTPRYRLLDSSHSRLEMCLDLSRVR